MRPTLDTRDNIRIFVGNNKLFADNIINRSANPFVRLEALVQIAHRVDAFEVADHIQKLLTQIPDVVDSPAPEVVVKEFNALGTLLAVRPYVRGGIPEQEAVMVAAYRVIAEATAGLPVPATRIIAGGPG